MKRSLSVMLALGLVALLAGVAFAQMGGGWMGGRMGPGMMGAGMMGGPGTGAGPGQFTCPGLAATAQTAPAQVTEEKAKELATEYATKYLPGFTVERVLPFTGMHRTMYQAELKGPSGEARALHINPWGNVMPFGGPVVR